MAHSLDERQHPRSRVGRFIHADATRGDAGQVLDAHVVSETFSDGGATAHRTYSDGTRETETRTLWGRATERTMPDGSRTRVVSSKRYVTDHEGDVEDVLFTTSHETWSADGAYQKSSVADSGEGTKDIHTVEAGRSARVEMWQFGDSEQTTVRVVLDGDDVVATMQRGEKVATARKPRAELGSDPLGTMSKRVRQLG